MFFEKIKKISGVGSFKNFKDSNLTLNKSNIFYGLNGTGKTTLTSVFRSLKFNKSFYLTGRKTIGSDKEQEVILKSDKNSYIFKNSSWHKEREELCSGIEDIIIFDDEFINNNIFAEQFEIKHKKALYKIIFGREGVKLSEALSDLRIELKQKENELEENSKNIKTNYYNLDDFLELNISKIESKEDLNKKLENIKKKENDVINSNKIKSKKELNFIDEDIFYDESTKKIFLKNIDNESHNKAKKEVEGFLDEYFQNKKDANLFLKTGYFEMKKNLCPFCHNEVDSDLLGIYKNFFDDSYKEFEKELKEKSDLFYFLNLETKKEKTLNILSSNKDMYNDWILYKNDLSRFEQDIYNIKESYEELIKSKNVLQDKLNEKNNNPSIKISEDHFLKFEENLEKLSDAIKKYNEDVNKINKEINDYKESIKVVNIDELNKEKRTVSDQIFRFEKDEECNGCRKLKKEIEEINKGIIKKENELSDYESGVNSKYLQLINKKLKDDLGVNDFKIKEIQNRKDKSAKDVFVEIDLNLRDQEFKMSSYSDEEYSFKNTLSRGERNSLAFAFFLAFWEELNNKQDYIIILDDPLSSHDENRKNLTAKTIKRMSGQARQSLILTHNLEFLDIISREIKSNVEYFEIKKNSIIKIENISHLFKERYKKIIERFEKIIKTESLPEYLRVDDILNDVRQLFECILMTKYYNRIKEDKEIMNGNKQLINYNKLKELFFNEGLLLNQKEELLNYCHEGNDNSHYYHYDRMNEKEVANRLERLLTFIEKI